MTDEKKNRIDAIITRFQSTKVEWAKNDYEKVEQQLKEISQTIESLDQQ